MNASSSTAGPMGGSRASGASPSTSGPIAGNTAGSQRQWPDLLRTLVRGEPLTAGDTEWAMDQIMRGQASTAHIAGFAIGLRAKGESVEEVTGLARAMLAHATKIDVSGPTVDLVGTGGDGAHTVNISTMGAIVAAAAGARVVKHGNRAASSSCGAADLLEALGIVIDLDPRDTAAIVDEVGITFCFAAHFHPAFRHVAPTRRELGVPTVFNFLGPLTNPARPVTQAVGVSDPRMCEVLAGVLAARGSSGLVFHGHDGLDELTPTTTSMVWVVSEGAVREVVFDPADVGIARSDPADLRGSDPAHNATIARAVFSGDPGASSAIRDAVSLNAAAALVAAEGVPGAGSDLKASLVGCFNSALAKTRDAIDSGKAAALLDRWIEVSTELDQKSPD